MYLPRSFRVQDCQTLAAFMQRYSFATVVTAAREKTAISHVPLLLHAGDEPWRLCGHLARANPHWWGFAGGDTTAVFHGPHSYVSPAWYADSREVPTWNYAVVHAAGPVRIFDDREELETLVEALTEKYEALHGQPWDRALPEDYKNRQFSHIVGFELRIQRLEGKFKLGQNRSAADRTAMHGALSADDDEARALARFIERHDHAE